MSSRATCAVVREQGGPFLVEDVSLSGPPPDEILVEVVASGMCHTDLLVRDDRPAVLPAVLGHEGAGMVREVGLEDIDRAAADCTSGDVVKPMIVMGGTVS